MAAPSKLPEWNTDGSNRVEPSSGRKASGHAVNDVPSSGNENWWKSLVNEWITHLQTAITHVLGVVAGAYTWTGIQKFNASVTLGNAGSTSFVNGPLTTAAAVTAGGVLTANSGANVYGNVYAEGPWTIGRATSEAGSDGGLIIEGPVSLSSATGYLATLTCGEDATFNQNAYFNNGLFVANTHDVKYSPSRSFNHYVIAPEMFGGGNAGGHTYNAGQTETTFGFWYAKMDAAYGLFGRFHLPPGAVISDVYVCVTNHDGAARTLNAACYRMAYNSNGDVVPEVVASINAGIAATASEDWQWVRLTNGTTSLYENGVCWMRVTMPVASSFPTFKINMFRVTYTLANLRPAL